MIKNHICKYIICSTPLFSKVSQHIFPSGLIKMLKMFSQCLH